MSLCPTGAVPHTCGLASSVNNCILFIPRHLQAHLLFHVLDRIATAQLLQRHRPAKDSRSMLQEGPLLHCAPHFGCMNPEQCL